MARSLYHYPYILLGSPFKCCTDLVRVRGSYRKHWIIADGASSGASPRVSVYAGAIWVNRIA